MTTQTYREWLARGRKHQVERRFADAVSCYRRAALEDTNGVEARYHLGEALWQLTLRDEAIGAWRDAVRVGASFLPARLTLTDALLTRGEFGEAEEVARQTLALVPDLPRAHVEAGVARVMLGDIANLPALGEFVMREPSLAEVPALAQALSSAPVEAMSAAQWVMLSAALGARLRTLPSALLAVLAERNCLPAQALEQRDWLPADADSLRRIALAWRSSDPQSSRQAADRYSRLVSAAAPVPPLLWPRRTHGQSLRIGWLVGTHGDSVALSAQQAALEAVAQDVALAAAEHTVVHAGTDEVQRASVGNVMFKVSRQLQIPPEMSPLVASALAALDLDVLVDLAGLAGGFGPILAARPARLLMAHEGIGAAAVPPLVDVAVGDDEALRNLLREKMTLVPQAAEALPDAQTLGADWNAAVQAHQAGDSETALAAYRRVLDAQPEYALAHRLQGALLRSRGDSEEAIRSFTRALTLAPDFAAVRVSLAEIAVEQRRAQEASLLLREGLARRADSLELWRALGHAELARGEGGDAAVAFGNAILLAPADGELHYNQGVALQMQGNAGEAARAYQRALLFRPDLYMADFNLGVMFTEQGRPDAAISAFAQVLAKNPDHVEAWRNKGEALFAAGRFDEWVDNYRRFERQCPKSLSLAAHALEVCQHLGDYAGVDRYLNGLLKDQFQAASAVELVDVLEVLLFLLLNFDIEPQLLARLAQMYEAAATDVYGRPLPGPAARRPGKLRIGYLSGDLRDHVMGKMIWQAVAQHDRERFELYFYSTSKVRDAWTEKFAAVATRFEQIAGTGETPAALQIARDDLDVLVDLSTHTKFAMPGILARKPARVQITHVASCGNVGLSAIDFKLTDKFADIPENQAYQQELLLPMDGCVYPYRHIAPAQMHPYHRANFGVAADAIVIGVFVSLLKLSRRCLALWREVLIRLPRATLAFSPTNPALRPYYVRVAAAAGIAADRLVFLPQGRNDAENQARYSLVDFTLDTMPYGGVNGTLEALDAGVPVVTLKGRRHGERSGYSILANLGVLHTVAESGPGFVELAVRLAEDRVFAAEVRAAIKAGLATSPLVDMAKHTRALESAYLSALQFKAPDVLAAVGIDATAWQT